MPTVSTTIANPNFEAGDTGWTKNGGWVIASGFSTYEGSYSANIDSARTGGSEVSDLVNNNVVPASEGKTITVRGRCWGAGANGNVAAVLLIWYDASFNVIGRKEGNYSNWGSHSTWDLSTVTDSAPSGTAYAGVGFRGKNVKNGACAVDAISWDYVYDQAVSLASPANGATYGEGEAVPLAVNITGTSPSPVSVEYFAGSTSLGSTSTSPFNYTTTSLAAGTHSITAVVTFDDNSTLTTSPVSITIEEAPEPPTQREFKASNAYAYLIGENFTGLSEAMPSTARVTAAEIIVDYKLKLLVRSKNKDTPVEGANPNIVFDITDGGKVEAIMLTREGSTYSVAGSAIVADVPIELDDFDITETGVSEGKKWTVFDLTNTASVTLGNDASLFGVANVTVSDFIDRAIGLRFLPNLLDKPSYADAGDACIRFLIDKIRMRVYFDAGSATYYFASPDKTQVLEGELVHATVESGNFTTADASGVLQLKPKFVLKDGAQEYIGTDWTVHAAYPPTAANQIAVVAESSNGHGMSYNGLPTQWQILNNRSRYTFMTSNFYGDEELISIYGANGVGRAFAYNGKEFYTIQDHPDAEKDKPRHLAYHHGHLALGYKEGRVDISVIGQPYNFSGLDGASSWALGDRVVGLQSLSGTVLGAFCQNSIWGISGTTVDNFATQIISPKMGAIEYTVSDMGFPVYANAYGIYTLAQTQQYGDYLGTPMSQDISPWLRPRLIRKENFDKEVVTAWPVRAKNQYKIAFADGYVLTMTMNFGRQEAPTFSKQKYFLTDLSGETAEVDMYAQPSIVPAAISSELDHTGEERIHVAPKVN